MTLERLKRMVRERNRAERRKRIIFRIRTLMKSLGIKHCEAVKMVAVEESKAVVTIYSWEEGWR